MNQWRNWLLLILCLASLLLTPGFGQKTSGTISGVVADPSGAVVANASVTVTNTATGQTRTVSTDVQGGYTVPDLQPGIYTVAVKAPNFKEAVTSGVELHVASTAVVDVKLQLGGAAERVEVNANTIQVQTDSAALGEVIDNTQVRELPLNGRSFVQLTQLAPGVSAADNFDSKNKGLQGGVDFSVNGNATTNNLFMIDGAMNNDSGSQRTILLYPSIESIAEFKMLRNAYGPEYGQASGAVISIVTKSGGNQLHGSVFYNGRNDALSAADYFAARNNQKDVLRRHDFGYSVGGPVKKDKLFFFWNQEWNREKRGITRTACVPTAAERAGDFTTTSCNTSVPDFSGLPVAMVDPNNPHKLRAVDPAGALLIQKFPLPNIPTRADGLTNWAESESSRLLWREENARADFNITKAHSLMFRYTQDTWTNPAPTGGVYWGDDQFPTLTGSWAQPSKSIVTKLTSTLGGSMINDAEFAYSNNRINISVGGTNPGLQQQISDAIPPLYPSSIKTAKTGIPTMWGGFGNYGAPAAGNYWSIAPWNNALDIYTFRDDISIVRGQHTFKAGVFIGRSAKDEDNSASARERPTFQPTDGNTNYPTGNTLANVLVPGALWQLSETSVNVRDQLRWRDYEFYFGDTWKMNRKLTVEYGIRYSLLPWVFQPEGNYTSFQPFLYDPTKPASDACNGLWVVPGHDPCGAANQQFGTNYSHGVAGPNKYLRYPNHHMFAPRLGLAWDPSGTGNWAVRAGVGQFFQRERVSPNNQEAANAPFAVNGNLQRTLGGATPSSLGGSASPAGGADPRNTYPNSWQWNLSVEHTFLRDTTLQVGYVGNRALHQTTNYDINAVLPNTMTNCSLGADPRLQFAAVSSWLCGAFMGQGSGTINGLRPYSNFGSQNYWSHNGDASYNSLQMLFKTRYKRSQLTAAYTWSHSISDYAQNNSAGGAGTQNFTDYARPWLDRGNSPSNRPHIFVANATFFLPELKGSNGYVKNTMGGWELSVIQTAASGNSQTMFQSAVAEDTNRIIQDPLNPTLKYPGTGLLQSQIGAGYQSPAPLRPLLTGVGCDSGRNGDQLFNPAAFTMVGWQLGTLPGNMEPRGFCPGPHLINTDFSVDKNWTVTEKIRMQFRLDFFNLFNHANFNPGVGNLGINNNVNCGQANANGQYLPCSPTNNVITRETKITNFGTSTQTISRSGRELQYGLKIIF